MSKCDWGRVNISSFSPLPKEALFIQSHLFGGEALSELGPRPRKVRITISSYAHSKYLPAGHHHLLGLYLVVGFWALYLRHRTERRR
jgi:hypothetical protein